MLRGQPLSSPNPSPGTGSRAEAIFASALFFVALVLCIATWTVGWRSGMLAGHEYRQAQTAVSAYWIDQDSDFSLRYPTPVLGKPWSIPMEFPLYQWTVVGVHRGTGWNLVVAARAVSAACFLLTLPAVFLLLGRWAVPPARRWLALAVLVSCPLLLFYSRAFLIETMALMWALWFWVAFEAAVTRRSAAWLVAANVAGIAAGLVKVTTLALYLLPIGAWALRRIWRQRNNGGWRGELAWLAGGLAFPGVATLTWVRFADHVKAANPVADFLGSVHMTDFNLGPLAMRLGSELWSMQGVIIRDRLTWWPLLMIAPLLFVLGGQHRRRAALHCGLVYGAALMVFPILYAYHDYYHVAAVPVLLLGVALALIGLAETARWRWLAQGLSVVFVGAQFAVWAIEYRPQQGAVEPGGDGVTQALRAVTTPRDVLVVVGQDWNSMTAYYSQRRALMLRGDAVTDGAKLDRAFDELKGERIGAAVIAAQDWRAHSELLSRLPRMGLPAEPVLRWEGGWIFMPAADRKLSLLEPALARGEWRGVTWAPGAEPPPAPLAGRWWDLAEMSPRQRELFDQMQPLPLRFRSSFEPSRRGVGRESALGAHPVTRLVFRVPAGERILRTTVWFDPGAYNPPPGEPATDGVELRISAMEGESARPLATREIDPGSRQSDRGFVELEMRFRVEQEGEIELLIGPGRAGRDTRDWVWLRGPLTIE